MLSGTVIKSMTRKQQFKLLRIMEMIVCDIDGKEYLIEETDFNGLYYDET